MILSRAAFFRGEAGGPSEENGIRLPPLSSGKPRCERAVSAPICLKITSRARRSSRSTRSRPRHPPQLETRCASFFHSDIRRAGTCSRDLRSVQVGGRAPKRGDRYGRLFVHSRTGLYFPLLRGWRSQSRILRGRGSDHKKRGWGMDKVWEIDDANVVKAKFGAFGSKVVNL